MSNVIVVRPDKRVAIHRVGLQGPKADGTVTSVNGDAGPAVVLDAADVGADRLGAQTIALLGDSITSGGTAFAHPTAGLGTAINPATVTVGPLTWAQMYLRDRLTLVGCKAVAGTALTTWLTTPAYSADIDALLAMKPRWLLVHLGTNDIGGNRTAAQLIADFQTLLARCQVAGVPVILTTIMPRGAPYALTAAQEAARLEVNTWLRSAAINNRGVMTLGWASAMTNGLLGPIAGYFQDGLHPNTAGAQVLGLLLADALALQTVLVENLPESADDPANIIANGVMAGATAGGLATPGWSIVNGAPVPVYTTSKVVSTDGPGEWQKIDITGAGALQLQATMVAAVNLVPGNRYVAEFAFRNASFTSLDLFKLYCAIGVVSTQCNAVTAGPMTAATFPRSGVMRTLPAYALAAAANVYFWIDLTGLGSVEIGKCRVRSLGP